MSEFDNEDTPEIICQTTEFEERSSDEEYEYVPPDGGWGWFVLSGSILINILSAGTSKCLGIFLVEIDEKINSSPMALSWILGLAHFFFNFLGPVSSFLCDKYGFRIITGAGGLCCALGLITGAFYNSLQHLYITFGIIFGIGSGLAFPMTTLVTATYFVKLRGFANGLSISGAAIGALILPPIIRLFIEIYGFRGASILIGGLNLHILVAAALYDPVQQHVVKVPVNKIMPNPVVYEKYDIRSRKNKNKKLIRNEMIFNAKEKCNHVDSKSVGISDLTAATTPFIKEEDSSETTKIDGSVTMTLKQSCESSNQNDIRTNTLSYTGRNFQTTNVFNFDKDKKLKTPLKNYWNSVYARLFRNPIFIIIIVSYSTTAIGFNNFNVLLPIYANSIGFDKNRGSYLLSIVALFDLIGRIVGGTLSDWLPIEKKFFFVFGLFFSGVFLSCTTFHSTYLYVSVFCALFGLAAGIYIGVVAVIIADLLGEENLAPTFGLSLLMKGILNLVGPPFCGFLYQTFGSYGPAFQLLGACHMFGALIWFCLPCKSRKQRLTFE